MATCIRNVKILIDNELTKNVTKLLKSGTNFFILEEGAKIVSIAIIWIKIE